MKLFTEHLNKTDETLEESLKLPKIKREFTEAGEMEELIDFMTKATKGPLMAWAKDTDRDSVEAAKDLVSAIDDLFDAFANADDFS